MKYELWSWGSWWSSWWPSSWGPTYSIL
jgi:hypothetical protein